MLRGCYPNPDFQRAGVLWFFDTQIPINYSWCVKVSVIIPTYQEKANIEKLINSLEKELTEFDYEFDLIICDDNSPDGTGSIVEKLKSKFENLYLVSGKKEGLGRAIVRGIVFAKTLKADIVLTMDADFSHDPAETVNLLREIGRGADFVIGSRYVKGGTISADWGELRRLISKIGNILAQKVIGLDNIKDCTSGFRAIKTVYLKEINLDKINEQGYAFQVRLLSEMKETRAKIVELPINFHNRKGGKTKLGVWDIIEFVFMSTRLGLKRIVRAN